MNGAKDCNEYGRIYDDVKTNVAAYIGDGEYELVTGLMTV